ncbi:PAS domain S-box protein [Sediminicurvatus halobius]|uniref:PAS domain S-box protein n=1 Tax=Sediminicurvatus halobius TaxID=2182432 RepID=UPI001304E0C1|nr:PAS domain S-box protein [Spiribacter halobius]UEX76563.1 PAS domain S-box protein [Spiribacter halobius]
MVDSANQPGRLSLLSDDAGTARFARCLRAAGHEVVEAGMAGEPPSPAAELVLLLPHDADAECVRQHIPRPGQSVLCLLPEGASGERFADLLDAGADGCLVRPVAERQLVAWVNAGLRAHRVNRELRDGEHRYRTAIKATSAFTWRLDAEGSLIEIDEAWLELAGLSREQALGWGWLAALHPADREPYRRAWEETQATGAPFRHEYRLLSADGGVRWFVDRLAPMRGEGDTVTEWLGVAQEVTARRRAEDEARARVRQQAAVARLGQVALAGSAPAQLFDDACQAVADGLPMAYAKVLECLPGGGRLRLVAGVGWRAGLVGAAEVGTDEDSQAGYTLRVGGPVIVRDLASESRFRGPPLLVEHGVVSGLSVVIRGADGPWGVLGAHTAEPREFSEDDVHFLEGIANVLSVTVRRHQMNAELAENQRLMAIASRAARLGGWAVHLEERRVRWSDEVAAIHGQPPGTAPDLDEAIGYYAPEYRARIRHCFEACASEGVPFDEELEIIDARGHRRWVRALGEPVRDGRGAITRVEGAFQDLTEHKRAEAELHRLGERLRSTLESITDAFFVLDRDWRFAYVNREAERLLARSRDELLGRNVWTEFPAAVGSEFQRSYERAVQEQVAVELEEQYGPLERWFAVRAYPTEEGLAVYFRDVTERRVLDERLQQAQRLESVGQLTGGVAHDFNNLLTVILGNAEALNEALAADRSLQPMADMVRDAAERGAELVRSLLAFARRQPLQPERVAVGPCLEALGPLLRQALSEEVALRIEAAEPLPPAYVDPAPLEAAVLNLVINARDAIPGAGQVTIEASAVTLDRDYAAVQGDVRPGRYLLIAVSDTGGGIGPEHLQRVFEPFFSTKGKDQGSGLGLSMVHGFVKQSGGHVAIYSELGYGTTVRVYLPVAESAQEAAAMPAAPAPVEPASGEIVLLVEDDALVREHVENVLRGLGYDVRTAADGAEALATLQREPAVDLLFTDVVMPGGLSGPELARAVRERRPELPVLFTSGYTQQAVMRDGRLESGVRMLQKPYRRAELAAKLREALGRTHPAERRRD